MKSSDIPFQMDIIVKSRVSGEFYEAVKAASSALPSYYGLLSTKFIWAPVSGAFFLIFAGIGAICP